MGAPNSVPVAAEELRRARSRGAHSVRISADLLDMLLNAHSLLSAAFEEVERREGN